jgi:predicted RNase H-like HicB family nuclease
LIARYNLSTEEALNELMRAKEAWLDVARLERKPVPPPEVYETRR